MRRPYIHLAGDLSGWSKGFTPGYQHLKKLDQFSSEMVNGDDGGVWAPSSPIVVGPTGVGTTMTIGNGSLLTGDIETLDGAQAGAEAGATAGLIVTGTNYPAFQTPRARDVVLPLWNFAETTNFFVPDPLYLYNIDPQYLAATRIGSRTTNETDDYTIFVPFHPRARHRNATLVSVDIYFRIKTYHPTLPTVLPRFRVAKFGLGGAFTLLHTAAGGYDANGWLTDAAATPADYWNNGLTRMVTYTPNQNNTAIEPADGYFLIQIRDERMNAAPELGNIYMSAVAHLTNITDYRPE